MPPMEMDEATRRYLPTISTYHHQNMSDMPYQLYSPLPAVLLLMSSKVVQAPIQLTKYDNTTNAGAKDLEIICPSMPITDESYGGGVMTGEDMSIQITQSV